jgi:hypothetical protein
MGNASVGCLAGVAGFVGVGGVDVECVGLVGRVEGAETVGIVEGIGCVTNIKDIGRVTGIGSAVDAVEVNP